MAGPDTIAMVPSIDTNPPGSKFYHMPGPPNNRDVMFVAYHYPQVRNP